MPDKLNPQKLLRKTGQNYQQRIHFFTDTLFFMLPYKEQREI